MLIHGLRTREQFKIRFGNKQGMIFGNKLKDGSIHKLFQMEIKDIKRIKTKIDIKRIKTIIE